LKDRGEVKRGRSGVASFLEKVQDAETLWRGMYRSLASNLASWAQRVIIGGCFRWPNAFAHLALNSRQRISDAVAVEFSDKEQMNLDQHCRPDHRLTQ